ncbi:component of the counting factor complex [Cavenderia fasciculata]|uniref:Component of the counting factor complex n=1 Tax=Cavenderia fasciculata TaxID=261658 RepID=F4PZW1_CACFS|nr:component of the counting factor complex [Cavenderia fasciculata]EGG18875.1 component of the counting factor complex [Cavenderia fasciculata]|eukprot:XP_004357337.1 component of the counting factor complex [Cavenderia fasciculata]
MLKQILFILLSILVCSSIGSSSFQVASTFPICSSCVSNCQQLDADAINIIANGGLISTCAGLCGYFAGDEKQVCTAACNNIGLDPFIQIITDEQVADPIYFCQSVRLCPTNSGTTGSATVDVATTPSSGPLGTTFSVTATYTIISPFNIGQIAIKIIDPAVNFFGGDQLITNVVPGTYTYTYQFTAEPSEQEPFSSGLYKVVVSVCTGTCGLSSPGTLTLALEDTSFTINN